MTANLEHHPPVRKVYKVVHRNLDGSLSSSGSYLFSIKYQTFKFTRPDVLNSKLFVFDRLYFAKKWLEPIKHYKSNKEIWSAWAINPTYYVMLKVAYYGYDIATYWNEPEFIHPNNLLLAPIGTILADAVQLIERIA